MRYRPGLELVLKGVNLDIKVRAVSVLYMRRVGAVLSACSNKSFPCLPLLLFKTLVSLLMFSLSLV